MGGRSRLLPGRSEMDSCADRKRALQAELADLRSRLPAHSVPPSMIMQMEDLEAALQELEAGCEKESPCHEQ